MAVQIFCERQVRSCGGLCTIVDSTFHNQRKAVRFLRKYSAVEDVVVSGRSAAWS